MEPIEERGCVAVIDNRSDRKTRSPYREPDAAYRARRRSPNALAWKKATFLHHLGSDVGGGFGYKAILLAEEIPALAVSRFAVAMPFAGSRTVVST